MKDNKSSFMILISARIKDKPSKQTSFTKPSGYNARKVISEVCTSFVLQCTVSGRECKHKKDVEA